MPSTRTSSPRTPSTRSCPASTRCTPTSSATWSGRLVRSPRTSSRSTWVGCARPARTSSLGSSCRRTAPSTPPSWRRTSTASRRSSDAACWWTGSTNCSTPSSWRSSAPSAPSTRRRSSRRCATASGAALLLLAIPFHGVAVLEPALIALVGPTASGKSAVALELAQALGGEVISCDSLQVFRHLDIGSAKPTLAERALVPHHLLDLVEPDAEFSAADYASLARSAVRDVAARGRQPIVVGGTGLYLRALLAGLFSGPSRDADFRGRVEAMAGRFGRGRVHRWLRTVDPVAAARIDAADLVRTTRALEVYRATRRPISAHHGTSPSPLTGCSIGVFGLALEREVLLRRVETRVDAMLAQGLLEEVRALLQRFPAELRPLRAIGYRQAVAVVRGALDLAAARRDMVTATMQYAKRQRTWFRHQAQVTWFATPAEARQAIGAWLRSRR